MENQGWPVRSDINERPSQTKLGRFINRETIGYGVIGSAPAVAVGVASAEGRVLKTVMGAPAGNLATERQAHEIKAIQAGTAGVLTLTLIAVGSVVAVRSRRQG